MYVLTDKLIPIAKFANDCGFFPTAKLDYSNVYWCCAIFRAGRVAINAVAYNTEGSVVAGGLMDGSIQLWDVRGAITSCLIYTIWHFDVYS